VGICGRAVRSVQLARTCGSGFRWVSSSASTTARRGSSISRATIWAATWSWSGRRGRSAWAACGAPELPPVLTLASGARTLTLVIAAAHRLGRLLAPCGLLLTLHGCSSSRSSLGGSTGYERSTLCVRGDVVLWVALQASLMAECLADGAGDADCGIGVSELVGASHVSEHAADGDLGLCHAGRSSCRR
jgi:hypothetical protein